MRKNIEIKIDKNSDAPITLYRYLKSLSDSSDSDIIGAEFEGRLYGLEDLLDRDGQYQLLTVDDPRGLDILWHSASHILAQAVLRLYPHAKLGVGPAIKDGFYYDFDFGQPISIDDFPKIEAEMQRIIDANLPIKRSELKPDEALNFFREQGQNYKVELVQGLNEKITVYSQGEFTDLCRGPHMPSTGWVKHFKLLSLTGAYWRGDERNPMLQRIYGTAYPTAEQLEAHLKRLEEAKKRDHRLLGKQLGLFSFHNEAPGAPFWHDKGVILYGIIENFVRNLLRKRGYTEVKTPLILSRDLWERSGHWDHYQKAMYFTSQEDRDYAVKPMNCPGAVLIFQERQWSYRDLPQRWAEMGIVHRYEKSGTLHGLFRVRHITQDDAHIFCTPEQLVDEVVRLIDLVFEIYGRFNMTDFLIELSTRPLDRIGSDDLWDKAEYALETALKQVGRAYQVNEGEGAFYGPKIDFHVTDSLGRSWQCSTIQVDFNFPQRFNLEYIGPDNQPHQPVMLHRAILGAMERFIGLLIEHYGGDFPLWLAPVQATILPISDEQHPFAKEIEQRLLDANLRVQTDLRAETIGKKIREAELEKIPYMLIIGAREAQSATVSLRRKGQGDMGTIGIDALIERMKNEINS